MRPITKNSNFKLTDEFRSPVGVISLCLGIASAVLFPVTVNMSFEEEGLASMKVGALGLFAFLFAIVGFILSIMDINNDDTPMTLPRISRNLNILCFLVWAGIMAWGIYGL